MRFMTYKTGGYLHGIWELVIPFWTLEFSFAGLRIIHKGLALACRQLFGARVTLLFLLGSCLFTEWVQVTVVGADLPPPPVPSIVITHSPAGLVPLPLLSALELLIYRC